ncbi:MAG: gliding motility-associated C-terminal domain-containing protein [Flavobacteriales bacterium]
MHKLYNLVIIFIIALFGNATLRAQNDNPCLTIQSILVDACAPGSFLFTEEGRNEMVRFKVGPNALNTADINVTWASNLQWLGLRGPDQTTAQKTAELNATIQACGFFLEPVNGVLPANSTVLLITSYLVSATSNSFAGLSDTVYVLYQNSTATGGHVLNYVANPNPDEQTVRIDFGNNCAAQVTYRRSELVTQQGTPGAQDGATVLFDPDGTATYINIGCVAPIIPLSPNWNLPSGNGLVCQNDPPINLSNLVLGTPNGTWSGQGVQGNFFNPEGLNGTYQVTYSVGVGQCVQTSTQTITVNLPANPEWNPPAVFCAQDQHPIDLNQFITGTPGGTFFGPNIQNNILNPVGLIGQVEITYRVGVGTCQTSSSQTLLFISVIQPELSTIKDTYCSDEVILPINANALSGAEVTWFDSADLINPIATGAQFTPSQNISATYFATQQVGSCRSEAASISIVVNPAPAPLSGPFEFSYCEGSPIPTITVETDGVVFWYADGGLTELIFTGDVFQPEAGQERFYVIVENEFCTSPSYTFNVFEIPFIDVIITLQGTDVLCNNESATLISSFADGNLWSNGASTQQITVSQTGWYIVSVEGECNMAKDSIFINNQSVVADFDANPLFGNAPLQVNVTNTSLNADNFSWFVNNTFQAPVNSAYLFENAGNYVITLIAENAFGCRDTATKIAEVVNNEVSLVIPNSFTPNGDGFNDLFIIKSTSIQSLHGVIYNRWGQAVHEWSGLDAAWDGTVNGRTSPDGVYFYIITAKDLLGNELVKQGNVTMLR